MKKAVFILFAVSLMQCAWDDIEFVPPDCSDPAIYENDISLILTAKCANEFCHIAANTDAPGDYRTYDGLRPFLENGSFRTQVIQLQRMPLAGWEELTTEEYQRIVCWAEKNYPEK